MRELTEQEKEDIITKALETEEGETALAAAMVEPIKKGSDYQAVGKKILGFNYIDETLEEGEPTPSESFEETTFDKLEKEKEYFLDL